MRHIYSAVQDSLTAYMTLDNAIYALGAFVLPFFTNALVLLYSWAAYKRTKHHIFAIWIVTCVLGLIGTFALYGLRHSKSSTENHGLWIFWSVDCIISGLLGTIGVVLTMREVLHHETKQAQEFRSAIETSSKAEKT
jgi:hypothetical protein